LKPSDSPGEILPESIDEVIRCLKSIDIDGNEVPKWFGRLVTEPKRNEEPLSLADIFMQGVSKNEILAFRKQLIDGHVFEWDESVRLAYFKTKEAVLCFINGEMFELTSQFTVLLELLSRQRTFDQVQLHMLDEIEGGEDFLTSLNKAAVLKIYSDDGT
jgi:ribosomal protein L16 Arg81 hydroxylase